MLSFQSETSVASFRITIRKNDLSIYFWLVASSAVSGSPTKPRAGTTSPRAEARAARESLYRGHILAAAEKVFADRPFEEAKVQDISAAAELSMGSIYAIFAGKDEIYASIADLRGREILARVREAVEPGASPLAALEALATTYIDYFFENTHFLRMNLRGGTAWALRPQQEHNVAQEIHELQTGIFERGIAEGLFVPGDPTYLAHLFTGIDQIHLAHWVQTGMKTPREELLESFLALVRRTFLVGSTTG